METKEIVRGVLDTYVGTQLNIDSESARDMLAVHIAERLDCCDFWNNMDQGQYYNKSDNMP